MHRLWEPNLISTEKTGNPCQGLRESPSYRLVADTAQGTLHKLLNDLSWEKLPVPGALVLFTGREGFPFENLLQTGPAVALLPPQGLWLCHAKVLPSKGQ